MNREEFERFDNMMQQAKKIKDSVYKDFAISKSTEFQGMYLKRKRIDQRTFMLTKIYISEWVRDYMFEVKVSIHKDGEKRKGVVPLEQHTLECLHISPNVIDFTDVEQEAMDMTQKLGWL